jgi:hypothetical protein
VRHSLSDAVPVTKPYGEVTLPGMGSWLRTYGTWATALAVAGTLTAVFGYMALMSILSVIDPQRVDPAFAGWALQFDANQGAVDNATRNASAAIGLILGIVVLTSIVVLIGVILIRGSAREAAVILYGILGLVSLGSSLAGVTSDPPARSAWVGIVVGLANILVVVLLLSRPTNRLFYTRPENHSGGFL